MEAPAEWRQDGNLPAEPTGFVGRSRLLASIKRAVRTSRMVTVTGIGGVGKTRIALRAAREIRSRFPDGVWVVDLSRLQTPDLLAHSVAATLGIVDNTPRPAEEVLAAYLTGRHALLILDTCEHLVDACAHLLEGLLDQAERLHVLATSRQSLGVLGEQSILISPLEVPPPDRATPTGEAVTLFRQRAEEASPGFTIDEDNLADVAELCRRLDGIPLAIELAAVRLRVLSVRQILNLLTDRFALLSGVGLSPLPRHQTLRAAIGWSHELCEPKERRLWARLSVFAGDFDLDAARDVCSGEDLSPDEILELVTGLVDKSILLRQGQPSGVRYRLLDTVREYGQEWLERLGERDLLLTRYRDYYLRLARRGEQAWSGPRQVHWFIRMRHEHANLRAALDHCIGDPRHTSAGLDLAASLWYMWVACGLSKEGRHFLERALAASPQPSPARCKALWTASYIASAQGDIPAALRFAEECGDDAVRIGDDPSVVLATKMLGTAAYLQGDLTKAMAFLGVAIDHGRGVRGLDPRLLPAVVELALVLTACGRPDAAMPLLRHCVGVCVERGELWLRSYADWALAITQRSMGLIADAVCSAREALRIKRHFHDVLGIVLCVETLAQLAVDDGDPERASRLLGAGQAGWRTFGVPQMDSPVLRADHDRCARECRRLLGEQRYNEAFAEGSAMPLDTAIHYAIGAAPSVTVA
ncbi:ATP-binding protein [Rhizohabitans arisaemae]|uniref:ATP-binding protein n=1 Tax=Rhizohabitans arisaemae TaxID=2720610 RepID=UPI0024B149EE|nr:NB-ARC domain-containing protein [Rhizohabitans arisaemae]